MTEDEEYCRKRAEQERARAAAADRPEVRRVHLELAAMYDGRLADTRPMLRVVG